MPGLRDKLFEELKWTNSLGVCHICLLVQRLIDEDLDGHFVKKQAPSDMIEGGMTADFSRSVHYDKPKKIPSEHLRFVTSLSQPVEQETAA